MKRFVVLLAGLVVSTALAAGGPRAIEVTEIVENIVHTHPEGLSYAGNTEFTAFAAKLAGSADKLDLADYIIQLHKLFSFIHDGHTAVLSLGMQAEPFTLRMPILVRPFADGLYIVEAKDEALSLLGGRLVSVNGVPVEQVLRAYVDGAQGDNSAFAMRWSSFLFSFPGWLHGLGFADGAYHSPITMQVETESGDTVSAELRPRAGANMGRTPVERQLSTVEEMSRSSSSPNFVRILAEHKAVYVSLDAMDDTETKSFAEFTVEVRGALADTDTERVILDLRRNGGGNNMLPEPLRRSLVKSRFNKPGGIVVLISPNTFSAAMNLATRLERESFALFVGEPTGGRPNHFGDPKLLSGSATGVNYLISTLRWQDSMPFDDRIWLLPDIPASPSFEDYLLGRDTALDTAFSYRIAPAAADDSLIAMPWTRPSQQVGWRFFFELAASGVSGPANQ